MHTVALVRADTANAAEIHRMQVYSFAELYIKYRDNGTNPGSESADRVMRRLEQPFTYHYFICVNEQKIGAVRVIDKKDGSPKSISPIFILPEYRGNGYAKQAIKSSEMIHGGTGWVLNTVLQEKSLCRMYETLGYKQTGRIEKVNDRLDLVYYEK